MDRTSAIMSGALVVVILVVAIFVYATTRGTGDRKLSADEGVAMFANLCTANVLERGVTQYDITREQINSACKCLSRDFQEELTGLTADQVSTFLDAAPTNKRMRSSSIKCFRRAGLDFTEE